MMDKFIQILLKMPTTSDTPSTSNHFGVATPFKVQVNFEIPLFEGNIDADDLEKWLSLLEGYFSIQNFPTGKRSPSRSLSPSPMSNIGGMDTPRGRQRMNLRYSKQNPLGNILSMSSKMNSTMLETIMTNTPSG